MNIQPANPTFFTSSSPQNSAAIPLAQIPEAASQSSTFAPVQPSPVINKNTLQPDRNSSTTNIRTRNTDRSDSPILPSDNDSEISTSEFSNADLEEDDRESSEFSGTQFSEQELATLRKLKARDLEVRTHEQAHQAVGGRFASAPTYEYERGPDGTNYAVSGEVSIQIPDQSGSPDDVIRQADQIIRAALAPAEPSAQDRQVAVQATQIRVEATQRLREEQQSESDAQVRGATNDNSSAIERFVDNSGVEEIAIGEVITEIA